jgi:hypothetical protein
MADPDYIKEWLDADKRRQESDRKAASRPAAPAPPPTAVPAGDVPDYIQQWLAGDRAQQQAAAAAPPPPMSPAEIEAQRHPQPIAEWIARTTREAHGHGAPNITTLVTGQRPDSWGDTATRGAMGVLRGIGDFGDTISEGIAGAGDIGAQIAAAHGYLSPETAKSVGDWRAKVFAKVAQGQRAYEEAAPQTAGMLGRVGGQIAATGPVLGAGGRTLEAIPGVGQVARWAGGKGFWPAVVKGGATGAGINALTSSASDLPLQDQVKWGALGGAALGPVGRSLGKLVGGTIDRETADLAQLARDKYGIPLRVDQISGNEMVQRAGALMQKTPFTGLAGSAATQQSAFNRAIAAEMGESADKITPYVMRAAKDRIGSEFERTLPKLEAWLNPKVSQRIQDLVNRADTNLTPDEARIVYKHVDNVLKSFTGASGRAGPTATPKGIAQLSGKQLQTLIAHGSPLDEAVNSRNSNVASYASQLKSMLLDAVSQTPTGRAKRAAAYVQNLQDFQRARYQWKAMKTIEPLAGKADTGDISPGLLRNRVLSQDHGIIYGSGGNLGELGYIGHRFIKPPGTSGTAEHLALMKLGALGLGAAGAAYLDPEHLQRDLLLGGVGLAALRGGGAALSGEIPHLWQPARWAIHGGQRATPRSIGPALSAGTPYLAPRHNSWGAVPAPYGANTTQQ